MWTEANAGYSDKVSLSSGVVFGLKTDTHLVGNQYAMLTVYFCE
jgi:ACS family allantoate permease-like MFS transporter